MKLNEAHFLLGPVFYDVDYPFVGRFAENTVDHGVNELQTAPRGQPVLVLAVLLLSCPHVLKLLEPKIVYSRNKDILKDQVHALGQIIALSNNVCSQVSIQMNGVTDPMIPRRQAILNYI